MNKHTFLLSAFLLLLPAILFPQDGTSKFLAVDSFVTTGKYRNDLPLLTKELTSPYSEQLFKARAIFKWITNNIGYDYRYYNKYNYKRREPKTYECEDDEDCEAKKMAWEIRYIDRVLKKKTAVCHGYSKLFKRMCDIAGVRWAPPDLCCTKI
ncbi:MAG TPA: transglutaminase-like domain-containing protein [Puia sp.]|jgi:transglutaminase/protease-like cytokinesis protein 3